MPGFHIDNHMTKAPQEPLNARTNFVFMHIHAINGVISSNQTGQFPITSNRGNAYIVVFYVYDANYIRSVPIKSRSKEELLCPYHETYKWLLMRGFKPFLYKMDNKTLHEVERFIQAQQKYHSGCVKLVDDGWTTKLTICDDFTRPPIPLKTIPISIVMATPTKDEGPQYEEIQLVLMGYGV